MVKCVWCKQELVRTAEFYDVQEEMHWICFHFFYEHHADPDDACEDPSCPWARIASYETRLTALGLDPVEVHFEEQMRVNDT